MGDDHNPALGKFPYEELAAKGGALKYKTPTYTGTNCHATYQASEQLILVYRAKVTLNTCAEIQLLL